MKLNIIGNIFGTSGYCSHTRGLANGLYKFHDVRITTQIPEDWQRQVNDQELEMLKAPDSPDHINIIIDIPDNWIMHANKKINIGFLIFEGDKIPMSWIDYITNTLINQVWVPSNHVYEAIKNTISENYKDHETQLIMNKVKIVPHGVNIKTFYSTEKRDNVFTFFVNKGFRNIFDRGGLQHALNAFISEFKRDEARLIVKLNPAYSMPSEQLNQIISQYALQYGKHNQNLPEIQLVYDNMTFNQLSGLYNNCDVFLSPTEGEAFSLPCIEAMACGKPVITTNFGGQTDFVDNENGWLIDYDLHEVKHEIMYEGINWATPNLTKLKEAMREAYSKPEMVKNKGLQALQISKDYTWENSAKKATQHLKALDK